jgi:DNA polymerase-1
MIPPSIYHHAAYDLRILRDAGYDVAPAYGDTMLMAYLLGKPAGLKTLAAQELGLYQREWEELTQSRSWDNLTPTERIELVEYSKKDVILTALLYEKLNKELKDGPRWVYENIELPLIEVVLEMERAGVGLDKPALGVLDSVLRGELETAQEELNNLAGKPLNAKSFPQVAAWLGIPKTGKDILAELATPQAQAILKVRVLRDQLKFVPILTKWAIDNRIYPHWNQIGTVTGRFTCKDPNLQQIPSRDDEGRVGTAFRRVFIAAPGYKLIAADYSQGELRVLAYRANCKRMLVAFESGEDIHDATARDFFGPSFTKDQRKIAKNTNFAYVYEAGLAKRAAMSGVDIDTAAMVGNKYDELYPEIAQYVRLQHELVVAYGYAETLFGRRRYFINRDYQDQKEGNNHSIQGTIADVVKLSMIEVRKQIPQLRLLLNVHDELVWECPEGLDVVGIVKEIMESFIPNLIADVKEGYSWGEAH